MDGFDHRANNDALDPHSRPLRRPPVDYVSAVVTDALEPDLASKISGSTFLHVESEKRLCPPEPLTGTSFAPFMGIGLGKSYREVP